MNSRRKLQKKSSQVDKAGRKQPVREPAEQPAEAFKQVIAGTPCPDDILTLQRTAGNRAVQRLLAQRQGNEQGFDLDQETAGRINQARGGGQSLEDAVQEQMSETLDYDFKGVRVHTDAEADELNQALSARAFTTGQDIFFRRGEYNPGSSSGRKLVAHELTHVAQQGRGRVSGGGSGMTVRPAVDAFEQEADTLARRAEAWGRATEGEHGAEQSGGQASTSTIQLKEGDVAQLVHFWEEKAKQEIYGGPLIGPKLASESETVAQELRTARTPAEVRQVLSRNAGQLDFEIGVIVDQAGNVLAAERGAARAVQPDDVRAVLQVGKGQEEASRPPGGTLIHNHPDGTPLSQTDPTAAFSRGYKRVEAIMKVPNLGQVMTYAEVDVPTLIKEPGQWFPVQSKYASAQLGEKDPQNDAKGGWGKWIGLKSLDGRTFTIGERPKQQRITITTGMEGAAPDEYKAAMLRAHGSPRR